jgi:hypothetical protein
MNLRPALLCALALAVALPSSARADGKAWAAVQAKLPAGVFVVGGVNMTKIRASKMYKTALPALIAEDRDAADITKAVKSMCKLDLLGSIDDAVVAMQDEDKGVVVIALKGVDQPKFDACLAKIAMAKENVAITSARVGDLVEYTAGSEPDKLYIAWLATDVIAVATEPTDKATLTAFLAGKGLKAELTAALAKVDTKAALWAAMSKDIPSDGGTVKGAYGQVALTSGKLVLGAHVAFASAAEATTNANEARSELARLLAKVPAGMQKIVKSIGVSTTGNDVVVNASMSDTSFPDLMKLFDKMF